MNTKKVTPELNTLARVKSALTTQKQRTIGRANAALAVWLRKQAA